MKYELSLIKNCVSSLPKWYEAIIKKRIKVKDGNIIQVNMTVTETKIYIM